jgi:hypothetical protein
MMMDLCLSIWCSREEDSVTAFLPEIRANKLVRKVAKVLADMS